MIAPSAPVSALFDAFARAGQDPFCGYLRTLVENRIVDPYMPCEGMLVNGEWMEFLQQVAGVSRKTVYVMRRAIEGMLEEEGTRVEGRERLDHIGKTNIEWRDAFEEPESEEDEAEDAKDPDWRP